jgi:hypothetical protein
MKPAIHRNDLDARLTEVMNMATIARELAYQLPCFGAGRIREDAQMSRVLTAVDMIERLTKDLYVHFFDLGVHLSPEGAAAFRARDRDAIDKAPDAGDDYEPYRTDAAFHPARPAGDCRPFAFWWGGFGRQRFVLQFETKETNLLDPRNRSETVVL